MHTSAAVQSVVCLPTRGWPLKQMYPIIVRVSLVTRLTVSSCMHPAYFSTQGLKLRILADPFVAVLPGQPRPFPSLATSGIAGLSWMLLLYSLHCFRHYLWLTWRKKDMILLFRGKLFYTVNILTVLWAWDTKAWHILSLWAPNSPSGPLYF